MGHYQDFHCSRFIAAMLVRRSDRSCRGTL